jgi:hypothetical protein
MDGAKRHVGKFPGKHEPMGSSVISYGLIERASGITQAEHVQAHCEARTKSQSRFSSHYAPTVAPVWRLEPSATQWAVAPSRLPLLQLQRRGRAS